MLFKNFPQPFAHSFYLIEITEKYTVESSKEYNEDNIPYKSDSFLKISAKGVEDNDFTSQQPFEESSPLNY